MVLRCKISTPSINSRYRIRSMKFSYEKNANLHFHTSYEKNFDINLRTVYQTV